MLDTILSEEALKRFVAEMNLHHKLWLWVPKSGEYIILQEF